MTRRARIPVSLDLLRLMLDLPPHLKITGVAQLGADADAGLVSILVEGPYCPEVADGELPAVVLAVFRRVDPAQARLEHLVGLDT